MFVFLDSDRPSFRFGEAKHIRNEVKRVDEMIETVSESMGKCRMEHAQELTDILHTKLGGDVNFVEAVDFSKVIEENVNIDE